VIILSKIIGFFDYLNVLLAFVIRFQYNVNQISSPTSSTEAGKTWQEMTIEFCPTKYLFHTRMVL
jgi:hypothetical protein